MLFRHLNENILGGMEEGLRGKREGTKAKDVKDKRK